MMILLIMFIIYLGGLRLVGKGQPRWPNSQKLIQVQITHVLQKHPQQHQICPIIGPNTKTNKKTASITEKPNNRLIIAASKTPTSSIAKKSKIKQ